MRQSSYIMAIYEVCTNMPVPLEYVGCFNSVQTQCWTPGMGAPARPCPAHLAEAVDVPKVTGVTIVRFPRYDLLPALKFSPTRILKVVSPPRPGPLAGAKGGVSLVSDR